VCLIGFAIRPTPAIEWAIAANRDEAYGRPTQALQAWRGPSGVELIGGRDLKDGGVWMAENPASGRLAFLTNVRHGRPETGRKSRGGLALAWLSAGDISLQDWQRQHDPLDYAGCNVVLADPGHDQWWWLTNRDAQGDALADWHCEALAAGTYALSNARLNTPWPKAVSLHQALDAALQACAGTGDALVTGLRDALWPALGDRSLPPESQWPQTQVPKEAERALAPAFVHWPEHDYGTRTSTVIVKQPGESQARWCEQSFDRHATWVQTAEWPPAPR